ncbi:hypothetical protein DFH07DRAFT_113361 [Mycena maculata]|uniref:F-box domain-containing protein n=1 Tax=Mycena maculata TaxID=230809 RepID=A0AAD7I6Y0_9AGAR|nr:hypothetical protein DFH07DRAFT_113361 [Mycena maculata]
MPFPNIEDIIENIVEQVFLDRRRADGVYDYESLPENFIKLALVSRNFLDPVRRNLYGDLRVEGPERFLLLTGQLRFSPHLAKYVKSASLRSSCSESPHIDGYYAHTPGAGEPRIVSSTAFRWFLEACPQLTGLTFIGGNFLWALSVQKPETIKLTDILMRGCSRCNAQGCTMELGRGWLKSIVTFPCLRELDISELPLADGPRDPTADMGIGSSACTGLSISNMNKPTSPTVLMTLFRAMPSLKELVLDGLQPMARGRLKKCLSIAAPTLTLLTITDYHSEEGHPEPWENNTVAALRELKTLSFNGVPVTLPFFDMLPPRLEHLRFSGVTLTFLPAPALASWLRRDRFPLRGILKKLEVVGELRTDSVGSAPKPKASDDQVAEIAELCCGLGIEWIYQPNRYAGAFDEDDISFDAGSEGELGVGIAF